MNILFINEDTICLAVFSFKVFLCYKQKKYSYCANKFQDGVYKLCHLMIVKYLWYHKFIPLFCYGHPCCGIPYLFPLFYSCHCCYYLACVDCFYNQKGAETKWIIHQLSIDFCDFYTHSKIFLCPKWIRVCLIRGTQFIGKVLYSIYCF